MQYGPENGQNAIDDLFRSIESGMLVNQIEILQEIQRILKLIKTNSESNQQGSSKKELARLSFYAPIECSNGDLMTPYEIIQKHHLEKLDTELLKISREYQIPYRTEPRVAKTTLPKMGSKEGSELVDHLGNYYSITKKLEGRGQPGLANFYSDGKKEVLIKEDEVDTCLLEGSAYWVKMAELLPPQLEDSVNFARTGTVADIDGKKIIVSIQDRVKGRPWDEMVYGQKRNPKTLWSMESWYPRWIDAGVGGLNSLAQWQLAAGIFASQAAGDESLHVAQFMAVLNKDNSIEGIKRIDLGARERFAVARNKDNENQPYHASRFYQGSGQFSKDYVHFLLKDPSLNEKYTMLWVKLGSLYNENTLKEKVAQESKKALLEQFKAIPEESKLSGVEKILNVINKSATAKDAIKISLISSDIQENIEMLSEKIAELDSERVCSMVKQARAVHSQELQQFSEKIKRLIKKDEQALLFETLVLHNELMKSQLSEVDIKKMEQYSDIIDKNVATIIEEIHKIQSSSLEETEKLKIQIGYCDQIALYTQMARKMLETVHLGNMLVSEPSLDVVKLNRDLKKYQTINDMVNYLKKSSANKRNYAVQLLLECLHSNEKEFIQAQKLKLDNGAIEEFSKHSGIGSSFMDQVSKLTEVNTKGDLTEGMMVLKTIYNRYGIDESYLFLTKVQRELLANVDKRNFSTVNNMAYITDLLAKDLKGKTALHYLMEDPEASNTQLDAIVYILEKSLSKFSGNNYDLDVQDFEGKTPLQLLLENKKQQKIVEHIKKETGYRMSQFFKVDKYSFDDKRKLWNLDLTEKDLDRFKLVHTGQFESLKNISIEEALIPNEQGQTIVHLLMKNASDKKAIEVLENILEKSRGIAWDYDLDIKDAEGKTPLDRLLENPNRIIIVKEISKYKLSELFNIDKYNAQVKKAVWDLSLTAEDKKRFEQANNKKFNMIKNISLSQAIQRNHEGQTILHILMKNAANIDDIQLILKLLNESLGQTKFTNTNLQIKDIYGKTPLDMLLENPYRQEIVKAINNNSVGSYMSGYYNVISLFEPEDTGIKIQLEELGLTPENEELWKQGRSMDLMRINQISFEQAIIPLVQKQTVLHILMKNVNTKEGIEAIAKILVQSVGRWKHTSLDIPDEQNKTPLHMLMENPYAEEIINTINQKHLTLFGKPYKIDTFFDVNNRLYDENIENNLKYLSQVPEQTFKPQKKSMK